MRAYYLTETKYALENLRLRRLKIARLDELNDPFELLSAALPTKTLQQAFIATKAQANASSGVICFSKSWRNPVLWAHYGDRHRGVALGFDIADTLVQRMSYATERLKLGLERAAGLKALTFQVMQSILTTKYRDWEYEKEVRVICELADIHPESGLYFADFKDDVQLREVVLGPRCVASVPEVASAVQLQDGHVSIVTARLAFNTFHVVRNKSIPVHVC